MPAKRFKRLAAKSFSKQIKRMNNQPEFPLLRNISLLLLTGLLCCIPAVHASAQLYVWGNSVYGQLAVPSSATNVFAMAAGDTHCLALRRDGTVVAWGQGSVGQTNVPADLTNAVSIAAGSSHSLALRSDGTISLWGLIYYGLNIVPPAATNVVALALGPGAQHVLVLRADGMVVDWGNPGYAYTNIPPAAVDIVSVASGSYHGLALRSDGKVVAWGDNSQGQLNVPATATNIVAIAAGFYDNAALRADGTVLVWGSLSTPPSSSGFTNVIDLAFPYNSIVTGGAIIALRRDGTLVQYQSLGGDTPCQRLQRPMSPPLPPAVTSAWLRPAAVRRFFRDFPSTETWSVVRGLIFGRLRPVRCPCFISGAATEPTFQEPPTRL